MIIQSLRLANFRNYSQTKADFHPHVNLFYGLNGQGKTNLIEALHLLLTGRSFRPSHVADFQPFDSQTKTSIECLLIQKNVRNELHAIISEQKLQRFISGKKITSKVLSIPLGVVVFSPESLSLVKDSSAVRRDFLDQMIEELFPEKSHVIAEYNRCLKARNLTLKAIAGDLSNAQSHIRVLDSLEPTFLNLAVNLTELRQKAAEMLKPQMNSIIQNLTNDQNVDISVDYVISDQCTIDWSKNQVYDLLLKRLTELRSVEQKLGYSLIGPHKHDVRWIFNHHEARFFCSQGQQRAIALAALIARAQLFKEKFGISPIVMLDDVFSEFDDQKIHQLFEIVKGFNAQTFITTTDPMVSNSMPTAEKFNYEIVKGMIKHQDGNRV